MHLYPLTFQPIFQERVWGGRRLADVFHKTLPADRLIGESWEIADRPDAVSVIANGTWKGRDLHWLMTDHRAELLGPNAACGERFPWLIKILDAQEDLSLQVHPPADRARELRGEPKDELWYFAQKGGEAPIYAGLRRGVSRAEFVQRTGDGTVAQCLHVERARAGDAIFVPSGRVHALGGGNLIFEIQQNSDTTYRVFDWNRVGPDGRRRELHLKASLASIDFNDFEPSLIPHHTVPHPAGVRRPLLRHPQFEIDELQIPFGSSWSDERTEPRLAAFGVVSGRLKVQSKPEPITLNPGEFVLIPAALGAVHWTAPEATICLQVMLPR